MCTIAFVMLTVSWMKFSDMSSFTACVKFFYCIYKSSFTYFIYYHFTYVIDSLIFNIPFIVMSLRISIYC
jgi:hypothetical protein